MSPSEWGRAAVYVFMATVALLFSYRMYLRARRDSGPARWPQPYWYDVVAVYLSSWVVVGYGIAFRIVVGDHWSDHSRWLLGFCYQGYAVIATIIALYYWVKPSVEVIPPPKPGDE